ncbi:hypothetical protein PMAYCL1PPCAC_08519, partial [Pristionchus mayeri]
RWLISLLFKIVHGLDLAVVGLGESDSALSDIVDVAVRSDPGVSEDPRGSESASLHVEEGEGAVALAQLEVEHVLARGHVVGLAADGEDHVGVLAGAGHGVQLVEEVVLRAGLLDDAGDGGRGGSDPGRTGVGDDLFLGGRGVRSDGEGGHGELPVGLGREGDVVDLGVAVDVVESSVGDETAELGLGGSHVSVEPHGEDGLVELVEQVLDRGNDVVLSECGPSETEDSVNGLLSEDLGDGGGDSESLGGVDEAGEVEDVSGDVSTAAARSVEDDERLRGLHEGRRGSGVELVLGVSGVGVSLAGLSGASGVDHPEVGGASVQDDREVLVWSSESDVSEVEVIVVVDEGLAGDGRVRSLVDASEVLSGEEVTERALLDELGAERSDLVRLLLDHSRAGEADDGQEKESGPHYLQR